MADVEDLLEDLEKEFGSSPPPRVTSPVGSGGDVRPRATVDASEIDRLLDEVSHVTVSPDVDRDTEKPTGTTSDSNEMPLKGAAPKEPSEGTNPASPTSVNSVPSGVRQRCGTVKVGGTAWPAGCSPTFMVEKKCDNLRCTKCDFRVIWFDDYAWSPSVNYIFLRNNVPDFQKLQEKLDPEPGACAYACQCLSRTARDLEAIGDVQWGCAGHR
eukprot:GGOE01002171.1.p1 GENE.GGOE01002171.1~~GGOE01002171.1.p1  ORF type:complete len:242 (+),score=48.30 GGOE01002171.1:88-726(+)